MLWVACTSWFPLNPCFFGFLGLPRKQKLGVKTVWVWEGEIGEECRKTLGVNLWGRAWNPGKTRPKNSQSKFAIEIRWEIRRQFSWNSPGQNNKITPNPLNRTSGSRFPRFFPLRFSPCVLETFPVSFPTIMEVRCQEHPRSFPGISSLLTKQRSLLFNVFKLHSLLNCYRIHFDSITYTYAFQI